MGIIITPPNRRNRQAEITSPATRRLRGLGMPETHERNMHGQNIRSEHVPPATPEASVAIAATATPEISREQTSEPAKPSLRDLAGVKPADTPTEQDGPKRDRPRLVFQPIHAVIAILTLSCALCASLTMLVQQAIHYSALQQTQITQSKQSQASGTTKDGASSPRQQHQTSSLPWNKTARTSKHPN